MAPAFFPRIFLATVATVLIAGQRPASGQIRDAFEGGNPRWVLGRNDVNASVVVQQFVPGQARSGVSSELIELRCSQGSTLQLLYPIPPCAIIDELRASVWVRNAASGVTLGFRVVFPKTAHPLTGNQLSAVLLGAETSRGGQWSRIEVRDPLRLMQQKIALLRSEYGPSVDLRGAFVDAVVINPYTGPGLIRLQLDDLEVDGNIELTAADRENDPGSSPMLTEDDRANDAALAQRLNDLQEGVPRWLQYRGESLSWLRTLGVTGVVVDTAKDQTWLKEARELGIKVLMPPPNATPPRSEWASYEAVQGWLLGSALDHTHIEPTRTLRHRLAQFPAPLLRPTLAESMEQHWMFARVADVLAVPAPLPSSIRDGGEMIQLLKQSYDQTRGRTIPLTSLTIQPSPEYVEQTKGILQAIGSRQQTPVSFDLVQSRMRLYRCIAAGARGWYLRSQTPLDSGDESDLQRAEFLKALNAEVDWLSPWIQAATSATALDGKQIPGYRGSSLAMNNSQLIVLVASGEQDSLVAPIVSRQPLEIVLPNAAASSQALRITHGRLEPVMNKVSPTESRIRLERPGLIELVVVTSDPNVLRYLQQRSRSTIEVMLDVHTDTANQLSRLAQATLVEEGIPDTNTEWRTSRDAEAQLRRVFNLASRDPIAAIQAAEESSHLSLQVVRRSWMRALNQFPKPQSSPWIENVQGLPIHWEVSRVVANRPWMQHMVPGMAMSDWQGMEASGWHLDRRIEHLVDSAATVMRSTEEWSGSALWLSAKSRSGEAISGGFAGSSMRVYSPPIDVPSGSLVRIDGRVQVRGFKPMPQSGLLVYDDVSGPASAILCSSEGADANGWQGFTLFRFLGSQQGVRVMMEVRGEGEYLVSDLRVSSLVPGLASGLPTTPVSLTLPSDR